jgi:hypothetical protein
VRFEVQGRIVIDCAAVLHQGRFHLFEPDNGSAEDFLGGQERHASPAGGVGYHATSTDGLKFTRVADVNIPGGHRWLGNAQSDGKTITFFGTASHESSRRNEPRGDLWLGTSTNGQTWEFLKFLAVHGADPGVAATRDGGWIVAVTGPPRPGTPSAQRRQPALPPPAPRGEPR